MKIILIVVLFAVLVLPQDRWTKLKGHRGGNVGSIVAYGDTLISGVGHNGTIFYSFNRGEKWQQSDFKIKDDAILDFIFTDDGGILASGESHGIFKSYDFINWRRINLNGNFRYFGKDDSGKVYAGTGNGQIYSSSNNGENWILELSTQYDVQNFLFESGKLFAGGSLKIFVKDTSWKIITTPFDSINSTYRIFSDPSGNIYVNTIGRILISTDTGNTWQQKSTGTFFYGNSMYGCIFNNRLIGGFGDETGWFGDGWGAAVSDDLGVTWRWSQTGLPPKVTGLKLAVSGTDTYLATSAAGVFKSTDFGDSWFEQNNGLNAAEVRKLAIDKDGIFYTASWANGLSRSTDKGETWTMINNGVSNVYFYSIVADDNGNLMAGSEFGVYQSTDKGESWILTNPVGNNFGYDLRKDKYKRIYCFTYGSGLYRTTDLGVTWKRLDKNFISPFIFAFDIDKEDNLYTGTRGGAIYKSTDDGNSWSQIYQNPTNGAIATLKISNKGNIFSTANYTGIIRSTDKGLTWEVVRNEYNLIYPHYPLAVNNKEEIFTTSNNYHIYMSQDNGNTWKDITSNTKYLSVHSFTVDKEDNIYLATDESIWKSNPDSLTSAAEDDIKPKEYFLSQNYPNPFNPSTTIKYSLPQTGKVTLSIYDLLGREIVKLIDEEKPAGEYETNWNASSHPSGVYFMRMQAGEFSEVRKIVLVK